MSNYYLLKDNEVQGPFAEEEIRSRIKINELSVNAQISRESDGWQRVGNMFPTAVRMPSRPAGLPPLPQAAVPVQPAEAAPSKVKPAPVPVRMAPVKSAEVKTPPFAPVSKKPSSFPRAAMRPVLRYRKRSMSDYGGIGRLAFASGLILLSLAASLLIAFVPMVLQTGLITIPPGILLLLVLYGYRLKNIGSNPLWCLLCFVPLLGEIVGIYCLYAPEGYKVHKELDHAGRIISYIIRALIVVSVYLRYKG